jgi:restriction system protein
MDETLPDGRNRLIHRLQWARTYLKQAGLLEYPERGAFKITPRGRQVLAAHPREINSALLMQFPEFVDFRKRGKDESPSQEPELPLRDVDPEESLQNSYELIRKSIEDEILTKVKGASPAFFEHLVIDLLIKMGYGGSRKDAGRAIGRTGDEGIDGIIKEDALGLDVVYVQAKRWSNKTVGAPDIREFVGALHGHRARKGVFITTSSFSRDAWEYIEKIDNKVVLIDGSHLATLMFDYDIGTSELRSYKLKRIDLDYFDEESGAS